MTYRISTSPHVHPCRVPIPYHMPPPFVYISQDSNSLVRAYKTYVRPLLEYNSVVWSPYQICQINAIEAVQRAFTKRLPVVKTFTYSERLSHLKS